ncbi:hypothetical protein ACS0TY_019385 [Phlomoides rotata]
MIDVASALEYLHHGYSTPIVHCDLKPSNVLLDDEMVAHVSDFGISKLLGEEQSTVLTNTLATLGYIAPEYGLEGLVSTRCDVYSYGVMLMETFTRKRPNDDMFGGDLSLTSWVECLLPQAPDRVVDANLLQCVSSILVLALKCSTKSPRERINIKEALVFNPDKSKAYFGKHVSAQNKGYFRATLTIGSAALHFTYLGVPIFRGAPKACLLWGTADRIISMFTSLKGSSLSLAGRACLVNFVIVFSSVHSMMIYKWPRSLLNKIDKAMWNFIWPGSIEKKGFCMVTWAKVCAPKEEGGLGIRSIKTANEAFLQRLAWNILNNKEPPIVEITRITAQSTTTGNNLSPPE